MIKRLSKSIVIAYIYYVHIRLLRWLGPRWAMSVTRFLSWFHWFLSRLGFERRTSRMMAHVLPEICPGANVSQTLRRYLLTKHQNFTEWAVYLTKRGRDSLEQSPIEFEGEENLKACSHGGSAPILLVYHFGLAKMLVPTLKARGYHVRIHRHVAATYAGQTFDWLAKAVQRMNVEAEKKSGLDISFHRSDCSFTVLLRYLKQGGMLSLNGDGMTGSDFVEVPLLGTTMSFPAGPAQMAARGGSPIVPIFSLSTVDKQRRLIAHAPIFVSDSSPEAVSQATCQCVAVLEGYIRRYPWAWWTWRRLSVVGDRKDGATSLFAQYISEHALKDGGSIRSTSKSEMSPTP